MSNFSNNNGSLCLDGIDTCALAKKYGTPLIVTSEKRIRDNARRLVKGLSSFFSDFDIKYAMKANPNPRILSILRSEGLGIDASSEYEIRLALETGFMPNQILFTPNYASTRELLWASASGVPINFDSLGQFRQIEDKVPQSVSFRIKIDYGKGEFKGTTTSGHDAKFGIMETEAVSAYKAAKEAGAKRFGIHVMAGSNVLDPDHTAHVAASILEVVKKITDATDIEFSFVDLGGGLGVPYQPGLNELDISITFRKVHDAFTRVFDGTTMPRLSIEPGRYLVADSSVLLGSVTDIKMQDKAFLGSDVSMNTLIRPALYGARHHIVLANRLNDDISGKYQVVGQICENTDRIGTDIELPEPRIDDILAVFDAGAYVSSMASNYNGRPIPAEVLLGDMGEEVIRSPSTFSDYIRNYLFNKPVKTGLKAGKSP
ncbi:MAG: diaminopimelate decarboxylase [Thermoplasmata archaeon]